MNRVIVRVVVKGDIDEAIFFAQLDHFFPFFVVVFVHVVNSIPYIYVVKRRKETTK